MKAQDTMSALDKCVGCGSPRRQDQNFCQRCQRSLGIGTDDRPRQTDTTSSAPGRLLLVGLLAGVLAIAAFAIQHGNHFPPSFASQHSTGSCISC
ncbi:hypothetical protein EDC39_103211 [Geothermobacter ehrlichii]|uniref:Uncharacterized protein n=1 Tax=Geothermobacter ehrlichii TaxID=213224 RepID=A0A5D3WK68_9BACT|nr:hypothetical protein [Geothermobacter ehrlichii]TYO99365.1 hypothetical protein EDC39_103211 [Geothermobacter ehrlichii]